MSFDRGDKVWAKVVSLDLRDRWLPGEVVERVLSTYYIVRVEGPVPLNPALVRVDHLAQLCDGHRCGIVANIAAA